MNHINTAVVLATICSAGLALGQESKQFLGIRAPQTALNAPYVFEHDGETALLGLYYRDGKRDVSALKLDGHKWIPIGQNGDAITGVGGNFITDFAVDRDGVPWLLTRYTRPSNQARANRFFLYTLKNDRWVVFGPETGIEIKYSGSANLFFQNDRLVLNFCSWNRQTQRDQHRLFVMSQDRWAEHPSEALLPSGSVVYADKAGSFIVKQQRSMVTIHIFPESESSGALLHDPIFTVLGTDNPIVTWEEFHTQ